MEGIYANTNATRTSYESTSLCQILSRAGLHYCTLARVAGVGRGSRDQQGVGDIILQSAGQSGAIHQGRQERDQMDKAVVSQVPRQRRSAPASRPGLQSRHLPADAGDGTGAFGQGRDHASDSSISLHGRAMPPVSGILREPRSKNAWRTAFSGLNLTEGTPNGECRTNQAQQGETTSQIGSE